MKSLRILFVLWIVSACLGSASCGPAIDIRQTSLTERRYDEWLTWWQGHWRDSDPRRSEFRQDASRVLLECRGRYDKALAAGDVSALRALSEEVPRVRAGILALDPGYAATMHEQSELAAWDMEEVRCQPDLVSARQSLTAKRYVEAVQASRGCASSLALAGEVYRSVLKNACIELGQLIYANPPETRSLEGSRTLKTLDELVTASGGDADSVRLDGMGPAGSTVAVLRESRRNQYIPILARTATDLSARHDFADALAYLEAARAIARGETGARIQVQTEMVTGTAVAYHLRESEQALRNGQYTAARQALSQAQALAPAADYSARERAIQAAADGAAARRFSELARQSLQAQEFDKAIEQSESALRLVSDQAEALSIRASARRGLGNAWQLQGTRQLNAGQPESALESFRQAEKYLGNTTQLVALEAKAKAGATLKIAVFPVYDKAEFGDSQLLDNFIAEFREELGDAIHKSSRGELFSLVPERQVEPLLTERARRDEYDISSEDFLKRVNHDLSARYAIGFTLIDHNYHSDEDPGQSLSVCTATRERREVIEVDAYGFPLHRDLYGRPMPTRFDVFNYETAEATKYQDDADATFTLAIYVYDVATLTQLDERRVELSAHWSQVSATSSTDSQYLRWPPKGQMSETREKTDFLPTEWFATKRQSPPDESQLVRGKLLGAAHAHALRVGGLLVAEKPLPEVRPARAALTPTP